MPFRIHPRNMCYYKYLFTVTNPEQRRIILFTTVSYNTVVNLLLKLQTAQMINAISTCKLKEDEDSSASPKGLTTAFPYPRRTTPTLRFKKYKGWRMSSCS